jgi:release factor glutamine methyltransferase
LLGTVEFCGLTLLCDKRALVPRPETEQLVELIIANCQSPIANILDVGTGSGVIALSLALRFPDALIMATDISADALQLAQENAARLGLDRVQFRQTDLFADVDEQFEIIVANLPYIAMSERPSLSREVLHDPEVALFSGEKGDELMRALVEAAPNYIRPGGLLALEIGGGHGDSLSGLLSLKNYHDISLKKDYAGVTRFLLARYG